VKASIWSSRREGLPATSSRRALLVGVLALAALWSAGPDRAGAVGSAEQLAGQRVVFAFAGTAPPPALIARIRRGEAAGVILFSRNVSDRARLRALVARLQRVPRPHGHRAPLLVMVDQEGGRVRRVPGAPTASARRLGRQPAERVERIGRATGRSLRAVGVNVDLAPVADVARPGSAMERDERTFGRDPARVGAAARAYARGLMATGVAATAKHFPGFGAPRASTDDHPVRVRLSAGTLRRVDGPPFDGLIADGVPLVMLSTAVYPALARRPAALSSRVVVGELRRARGFAGVTISDALDTPALAGFGGPPATAVLAARAGVDLLVYAGGYAAGDAAARALARAIRRGAIARGAAEEAAGRVLALRQSRGRPAGAEPPSPAQALAVARSGAVLDLGGW
jgi:beta-N-acetylhexosaminidase